MQMFHYLDATIKDFTITADSHHVELRGKQIALSRQKTGFGSRYFFICPECGKRVTELLLPTYNNKVCCQYCSGYHLEKHSARTNLDDQAPTELINYKISCLEDKLDLYYEYTEPFDESRYAHRRPKGMHARTFKYTLGQLHNLYGLREQAISENRCFTAREINDKMSNLSVELMFLYYITIYRNED